MQFLSLIPFVSKLTLIAFLDLDTQKSIIVYQNPKSSLIRNLDGTMVEKENNYEINGTPKYQ
jgi:hypothetical protein